MSLKARCIPPRLMQVPFAGTHGEKEIGIAQTLDSVYKKKHVASAKKNDKTAFEIERLPDTSYISFHCRCCPKQFDRAIAHIEIAAN